MVQNYQVIADVNLANLQQRVQDALQQGWQIQGGVSVAVAVTPQGAGTPPQVGELWAQAMVR
jgi:hypothetical protein